MKRLALPGTAGLVMLSLGMLCSGCDPGGGGVPLDPGVDVGGTAGARWNISYGSTLNVRVSGPAGEISRQTMQPDNGTFTLGTTTLNIRDVCARSDLACPQDVFPGQVTVTQPGYDMHLLFIDHGLKGPLSAVGNDRLLGNVDSSHEVAIALGVGPAGQGSCGLLGVSYATGQIQLDPNVPIRGLGLTGGRVTTSYSAPCLMGSKDPTGVANLTVEFDLPMSATRAP